MAMDTVTTKMMRSHTMPLNTKTMTETVTGTTPQETMLMHSLPIQANGLTQMETVTETTGQLEQQIPTSSRTTLPQLMTTIAMATQINGLHSTTFQMKT